MHDRDKIDVLSHQIIGAAIEVHRTLGPGLLESAYEACLCYELSTRNIAYQRQYSLPVLYKGIAIDCNYRLDILIEDCIIVELKSVEKIETIHEAQLLTYLRLSKLWLGLLINFNVPVIRLGIRRLVNG